VGDVKGTLEGSQLTIVWQPTSGITGHLGDTTTSLAAKTIVYRHDDDADFDYLELVSGSELPGGVTPPKEIRRLKPAQLEFPAEWEQSEEILWGYKDTFSVSRIYRTAIKGCSANGETTYQRDYRIGSQLKAMIDSAPGGSLIVNHHDRKASSADFVDAVSGTHGLAGAADTTIVVNRDRLSADGLIRVTGRDVREGQYAVTFSEGAWTLAGETLDAAQEAAAARSLMPATGSSDRTREVVQYVSAHPGCGSTDVEQALDLLAGQGRSYLKRLVDRGLIERLSLGRYGPLVPLLTVTDDSIGGVTPVTPVTPCVTPVPAGQKASVTPVTPVTPPPVTGPESRDTPPCVTGVTGVTERLRPAQTGVTHGVTPREGVTVNGQLLCTLCHRSDALIVFPDGPRCPEHYP